MDRALHAIHMLLTALGIAAGFTDSTTAFVLQRLAAFGTTRLAYRLLVSEYDCR